MRRATAFIPTATLAARLQRADDAGAAVAAALAIFGAVALAFCLVSAAAAQDGVRTEKVRFAPGDDHATLRDGIVGRESISYRVGAEAGQVMTVTLEPSNHSTYFNVYLPGSGPGDQSLANSGLIGEWISEPNRFTGALPASGDYTISVYMMPAAARRAERSDFTLDIAVTGATGAVVTGDFADGLQGGPDFWQVATSGGPLNVRAAASAAAAPRGQVANGTILRNAGGCRMAEGRRWCEVADPNGGLAGWAAGDFLREGAAP